MAAEDVHVELLPVESSPLVLGLPSICTATFFSGDSHAGAEEFVRARVGAIVALNPWLLGRLSWPPRATASSPPPPPPRLRLSWRACIGEAAAAAACFSAVDAPSLDADAPYEATSRALLALRVPPGAACIGVAPPPPLLRVTLLRCSDAQFAVFFSLSHAIADGATFYELHAMLGAAGAPPRALSAMRVDAALYDAQVAAVVGAGAPRDEGLRWIMSAGSVARILTHMAFARRPRAVVAAVPREWVTREKEKAARRHEESVAAAPQQAARAGSGDGGWVSTNDLVTSAVAGVAGVDLLLMAANLRGRVACVGSNDAGNYEMLLPLLRSDIERPEGVRAAVAGGRLQRARGAPLPGALASAWTRASVITNWASFYRDVALPGAVLKRHLPVAETATAHMESVVIFAPRAGQVGVIALTRSERLTEEALAKAMA